MNNDELKLARDPEHEALVQGEFLCEQFGGDLQKRVEDIIDSIENPSPYVESCEERKRAIERVHRDCKEIYRK